MRGGKPQPLPADPKRAQEILRDRARRARKRLEEANTTLVYPELARRPWRETVVG